MRLGIIAASTILAETRETIGSAIGSGVAAGVGSKLVMGAGASVGTGAALGAGSTAGQADAFWDDVVFLWGANGVDGSTTATVDEKSGKVITFGSNGRLEGDAKKFGPTSLFSPNTSGVGGYVEVADTDTWNLNPTNSSAFTIEFWAQLPATGAATFSVIGQWDSIGLDGWSWIVQLARGGQATIFWTPDNLVTGPFSLATTGTGLVSGSMIAICIEKNTSGKLRIYIDGVMRGSSTPASSAFTTSPCPLLRIGSADPIFTQLLDGYVDEIRITKGVARYNSDSGYTPAVDEFPRAGSSGHGASAGTSTATAVGSSATAGAGSSTGTGSTTGVGSSTWAADGSAAGIGTAAGTDASVDSGAGAAAGVGAASAVGAVVAAGDGAAAGVGAASAVGTIVAAVWNSADKATQIDTLTNGDRTAAKSADSGNWRSIRTTDGIGTTDKVYLEIGFDAIANGLGFVLGPATLGASILNSFTGSTAGSIGWQTNFGTPYGGWTVGGATIPSIVAGDVIGIAIDRVNNKWWMREVTGGTIGQWNENNASHDPETNLGGHTISDSTLLAASDWYFAMSILVPGNVVTIEATLLGTTPTGFTAY